MLPVMRSSRHRAQRSGCKNRAPISPVSRDEARMVVSAADDPTLKNLRSGFGKQVKNLNVTEPAYGFGSSSRDAASKVRDCRQSSRLSPGRQNDNGDLARAEAHANERYGVTFAHSTLTSLARLRAQWAHAPLCPTGMHGNAIRRPQPAAAPASHHTQHRHPGQSQRNPIGA